MRGEQPGEGSRRHLTRLAELVDKAAQVRGLHGLSEEELLEFGRLYRRASSALSFARSYGLDEAEITRLNSLVGQAYGLLYVSAPVGLGSVGRFFSAELPQALRRHGRLFALCAAIFLGAAVIGCFLSLARPDLLESVDPHAADAIRQIALRHRPGRDWLPADFRPIASSLIMVNNVQVSFFAFSSGILLGLGTLFVLVMNGFTLGAIAAGVSGTPAAGQFWAFVSPHGMIELPALIISATAGLLLGLAIIEPGDLRRGDALRLAGRQAATLMLGVMAFLVVAGLVEGLLSPVMAPVELKFLVAAVLGAAFWSYVLFAGRSQEALSHPVDPARAIHISSS